MQITQPRTITAHIQFVFYHTSFDKTTLKYPANKTRNACGTRQFHLSIYSRLPILYQIACQSQEETFQKPWIFVFSGRFFLDPLRHKRVKWVLA